jgi:protease YdgD
MLGTMTLSLRPPIDAVSDWALVRLDRPVCPAGGLAMSRRPTEELLALARERRLYNLAVHRDFESFALALGAPCPAARSFDGANWSVISRDFSRADDLLFHTCDTGGSSSGSPLLVDGPAGPEVVGLNVGTYLQSTAGIAREAAASAAATRPARDIANTAIAAHSLADRVDEFVARTTVRSPAALRQIQDALARQGAYAGPRDGRMRVSLSIAIKAFEARVGLPVTGRPTEGLRRLLVAMHDE